MEIFELLLAGFRVVRAEFPHARRGTDVNYSMADIGLSAFSLFFMRSKSFLSHQWRLGRGHGAESHPSLIRPISAASLTKSECSICFCDILGNLVSTNESPDNAETHHPTRAREDAAARANRPFEEPSAWFFLL